MAYPPDPSRRFEDKNTPHPVLPLKVRAGLVAHGLRHLADGLEPNLLDVEGGESLLADRLRAVIANVKSIVDAANSPRDDWTTYE